MYEAFFNLRERPFDLTPNPRFLVLTASHREVLLNLEYGIASRKGITLLIGEAGSGKTTVIRAAMERQPVKVHCVHLHNPTLSRAEFNEMLADRFGLSADAARSKAVMLTELETLLEQRRATDEKTVLIVDEAQSLPLELLEEIRLLANIETNNEKLLSVIIAGQPELATRLNDRALRQFKQRVALRCELQPLSAQETAAYIVGRIRAAGGSAAEVFTRQAVTMMFERSGGIPRTISVIADNALLAGYAAGQHPVSADLVAEVCRDFDLGVVTSAAAPVTAPVTAPVAAPLTSTSTAAAVAHNVANRLIERSATAAPSALPAPSAPWKPSAPWTPAAPSAPPAPSATNVASAPAIKKPKALAGLFGAFSTKRKSWFMFWNL